eukprot:3779736-Amphidinium_carterae.1
MAASSTTVLSVNQTTGLPQSRSLQSSLAIKTGAISEKATGWLTPALDHALITSSGILPAKY